MFMNRFCLIIFLLLGAIRLDAQALLAPAANVQQDPLEASRKKMLKEVFKDNSFVGGYFLYLSFFHDFNIEAKETLSRRYKPEVSKRLVFYFLNGLDQINDELIASYTDRGIARMDSTKYESAMTDFDQVLLYDPKNSDAYVNRAILFIISSQYDEAQAELNKARTYAPKNPAIFFNQGVILNSQGNKEAALKTEDSCLNLDAGYSRAHFEKGLILNSMNQNKQAIKELRKARSLGDPDAGTLIKNIKDEEDHPESSPVK